MHFYFETECLAQPLCKNPLNLEIEHQLTSNRAVSAIEIHHNVIVDLYGFCIWAPTKHEENFRDTSDCAGKYQNIKMSTTWLETEL